MDDLFGWLILESLAEQEEQQRHLLEEINLSLLEKNGHWAEAAAIRRRRAIAAANQKFRSQYTAATILIIGGSFTMLVGLIFSSTSTTNTGDVLGALTLTAGFALIVWGIYLCRKTALQKQEFFSRSVFKK